MPPPPNKHSSAHKANASRLLPGFPSTIFPSTLNSPPPQPERANTTQPDSPYRIASRNSKHATVYKTPSSSATPLPPQTNTNTKLSPSTSRPFVLSSYMTTSSSTNNTTKLLSPINFQHREPRVDSPPLQNQRVFYSPSVYSEERATMASQGDNEAVAERSNNLPSNIEWLNADVFRRPPN
ncbi:uncharacterized protein LY89DRAFT_60570 [Mollisia scopiformis]|uniref:Uncharacterized protein n=1 Tax=Mollisia scopiformis TaxID=149040 RepID=A0A194XC39_MOLSC|nr:uncharacterized protein LY89DRAFT_60570 [Mollisia scopiformis]KUJ17738.1 hypothetical protein LY89DRAFT_60570 [Mollisia scopiformis]